MHKNWKRITAGLIGILTFFSILLILGGSQKIKTGVKIEGIAFSGYTKQAAVDKLSSVYKDKLSSSKMIFKHKDKIWEIPYASINAKYNIEGAVNTAYEVGRQESLVDSLTQSVKALVGRYNFQVGASYDVEKLRNQLTEIGKELEQPPFDARLEIEKDGKIKIIPEQTGIKLDVSETLKMVEQSLLYEYNQPIELKLNIEPPKFTAKQLEVIDAQIGYGQTAFNTSQINRSSNIRNAIASINGKILMPGETFSLNSVLGPRNEENGYKSAPVILNNKLVPGIGGGICQVATTLYNAVLSASMHIVERHHHTFPPAYVAIGQDATIAGDDIDFKFKNNKNFPVFINAEVIGNKIRIKLFSKNTEPGSNTSIESQILNVYDPGPAEIIQDENMASGIVKTERDAQKGYRVSVFRNTYSGGKLIKRENISSDYYKPIKGIVRIGTGKMVTGGGAPENASDILEKGLNIEEPDNPPDKQ